MAGIVYAMTNEGMAGLVKIGQTKNLPNRVDSLSRHAGVPLRFVVRCAVEVEDADKVETLLHEAYSAYRINSAREFFKVPFENVVAAMKLSTLSGGKLVGDDHVVGDEESESTEESDEPQDNRAVHGLLPQRGTPVDFSALGIHEGAELVCARYPDKKAKVAGAGKVEYEGDTMSISRAARQALGYQYPVSGMEFWEYEGEILSARRRRLLAESRGGKQDEPDEEDL